MTEPHDHCSFCDATVWSLQHLRECRGVQLTLPRPEAPQEATQAAAKAIQQHLEPKGCELKGDPSFDWLTNEWIALVAVTPWGPLVKVAFGLSRVT